MLQLLAPRWLASVVVSRDELPDQIIVLGRPHNGWLPLYVAADVRGARSCEVVGAGLSESLSVDAVAVSVAGSDTLELKLFERGACVDHFSSNPSAFEKVAASERRRLAGNAAVWAQHCGRPKAHVQDVFKAARRSVCAEDALPAVAELLSCDGAAIQRGWFGWPKRGLAAAELDAWLSGAEVELCVLLKSVAGLSRERQAIKQALASACAGDGFEEQQPLIVPDDWQRLRTLAQVAAELRDLARPPAPPKASAQGSLFGADTLAPAPSPQRLATLQRELDRLKAELFQSAGEAPSSSANPEP